MKVENYTFQNKKEFLEKQLERLNKEREEFTKKRRYYLSVTLALISIAIIVYVAFFKIFGQREVGIFVALVIIFYSVILFSKAIQYYPQDIEQKIFEIQNEIDLLSIDDTSLEERAEKLFRLHQLELKKYYDQTLNHSKLIFIVGIFSIFAGFVFIGIAFYLIFKAPITQFSEKVLVGALGSIGAILSNFVAVIFVKMYSETIKSLTEFHNRLVITHYLHFGNFLVSKIKDDKLREETLSKLAESIILTLKDKKF